MLAELEVVDEVVALVLVVEDVEAGLGLLLAQVRGVRPSALEDVRQALRRPTAPGSTAGA